MGKKSSAGRSTKARVPKTKCCVSKDKCSRCPLRMLKEGTLPAEYAVKKRRLVHAESMEPVTKDQLPKKSKKGKKSGAAKRRKQLPVAA